MMVWGVFLWLWQIKMVVYFSTLQREVRGTDTHRRTATSLSLWSQKTLKNREGCFIILGQFLLLYPITGTKKGKPQAVWTILRMSPSNVGPYAIPVFFRYHFLIQSHWKLDAQFLVHRKAKHMEKTALNGWVSILFVFRSPGSVFGWVFFCL